MGSRKRLALVWQAQVRSARQRYEEASREFCQLAADFREGLDQSPDNSETLRLARQRESLALNEYMRTLKIYSDLVLKGVLPDEAPKSHEPAN